jgi:threonine dehydrogenase-like Zn-dependent dehydrogenase
MAFLVGIGVGLAVVSPVLPEELGAEFAAFLSGGGTVILAGVGALGLLMVLLALFYQLYL